MTSVDHDPRRRTWLLTTPATSYAIRLDDDDTPQQLHWGPRLSVEQLRTVPVPARPDGSFDDYRGPEEYPTEGGARFGPPSLLVRHADGSRGIQWEYTGHHMTDRELVIRLRERHHPLACDLHYRVATGTDVIERWTVLRNTAADGPPTELLRTDSACWTVPPRADHRLSHVTGGWSAESRLTRVTLPRAETTLTSRRGTTSHQTNPWLMLDGGDATEEHGEVWSTALAWSGSWRITVERAPDGYVRVAGGFGHDGLHVRLRPGETWTTPVFAGLYSDGGFGGTSRLWHRYTADDVLPEPDETRPVLYNSWEATGFDVSEANQLRLAATAAELGVELFVVDDGWFGARRSDAAGLGDWTPTAERFPRGLAPLAGEVHRLGMKFGLWVEPEMVNPDSDLYRAHPDWVLRMPHHDRTLLRNQLVLDFADPRVASWAHAWLDELVTRYSVDYLKWDMNRAFTDAGRPGSADPDRVWFDHTHAVYEVMRRLRTDHPHLRIEACSGGGGRADLGVLRHTDQVWTSDNTDAHDRIAIQNGYSQLYPARTMSAWVTDSPNPLTGRRTPLAFRFHIAMTGVLGIGGDLVDWSAEDLEHAARLVAEYKDIRPVVQFGVLHRLDDAVQYVLDDRVVVIAWRLPRQYGTPALPLRLPGLDPDARYTDEATGHVHHGSVLASHGLRLGLGGDYASTVVRLRRLS